METLENIKISRSNARKLYSTMPEFKSALEDTFGKAFFSSSIIDRIKSYEDACAELGEESLNESEMIKSGFTQDEIDYRKLKTITKAYNEGWVADYNNPDQKKWCPWFNFSPSGVRFGVSGYDYSNAGAGRAARLCLKSEELSNAAGKDHTELYAKFIN